MVLAYEKILYSFLHNFWNSHFAMSNAWVQNTKFATWFCVVLLVLEGTIWYDMVLVPVPSGASFLCSFLQKCLELALPKAQMRMECFGVQNKSRFHTWSCRGAFAGHKLQCVITHCVSTKLSHRHSIVVRPACHLVAANISSCLTRTPEHFQRLL